jgi:hypothetical protein
MYIYPWNHHEHPHWPIMSPFPPWLTPMEPPWSNLEFLSEFQVANAFGVVLRFGKPQSTKPRQLNWFGVNGCQWMSMVRYHQTWLGNPELNRGWVRWENHRTLAGGFSRHGADYRRVVSMNFDMWQIWLMVNDLICWWLISRGILNKKHMFWFLICANSSSVFDKNDGLGFGPLFAASCFHSSE